MPLIYRAMQASPDGPVVGHNANDTLGVRETVIMPDGRAIGDITPVNNIVSPNTGGMSVSPSKEEILPHLIQKKHRHLNGRRSNNKPETFPWRMGEGIFVAGPLCAKLAMSLDLNNSRHGLVEPDQPMPLTEYREAIEATQSTWIQEQW